VIRFQRVPYRNYGTVHSRPSVLVAVLRDLLGSRLVGRGGIGRWESRTQRVIHEGTTCVHGRRRLRHRGRRDRRPERDRTLPQVGWKRPKKAGRRGFGQTQVRSLLLHFYLQLWPQRVYVCAQGVCDGTHQQRPPVPRSSTKSDGQGLENETEGSPYSSTAIRQSGRACTRERGCSSRDLHTDGTAFPHS
jgi:hypothetical protein